MTLLDAISVALLVLPFIDWLAVYVLNRVVKRSPKTSSLRERRLVALAIASLTTIFALLSLARLALPGDLVGLVTFQAVLLLSLVNLVFIIRYWKSAWQ